MTVIGWRDRKKVPGQDPIASDSLPDFQPEVGRYGIGVVKWSGGFNNSTGKENDFGFIDTEVGDVFFHRSNAHSPWDQLSASTLVMFRWMRSRGGKIAASEVGVLAGLPDEVILRLLPTAEGATEAAHGISTEEGLLKLFSKSSGLLREELLKRLVWSASETTLSKLADFIAANLRIDDRVGLLNTLVLPALLRQGALALRMVLPRHAHLKILATLPTLIEHQQEAVAALKKPEDEGYDASTFWNAFPPRDPKDVCYQYAPEWVKKKVCKTYYADFLNRWDGLFDHLVSAATSLDAGPVYASLSRNDRELAALWAGDKASKGNLARMLSARAAEVAAATFYRDRGCKVDDVAIGQITREERDWRTHDLLIDGLIAIDVKNSRRPMHNKAFYVEHTIPKFKLDRMNRNVRIAGILSPYVNLEVINNPSSSTFPIAEIFYLGETHADHFERLVQAFHTPTFSLSRERFQTVPNWLFDYPEVWYSDHAASVRTLIDSCAWPQEGEWRYTLDDSAIENALQKFYAIGIDPPQALVTDLPGWKSELYGELRKGLRSLPRLPAIYLIVINDFIKRLREPSPDFTPLEYKSMLFPGRTRNSGMVPLGTIDPLRIVERLIDALSVLWPKRDVLQLGKLVTFRFTGLGILQGKAIENPKWTTILAHCGGAVFRTKEGKIELNPEGKPEFLSKCGHAPLIKGVQKTCNTCGYLICDKCQFCCKPCEAARLTKLAEDEKKNVRCGSDYRQGDSRGRPAWAPNSESECEESSCSSNRPPDWDVPIEAYENDS